MGYAATAYQETSGFFYSHPDGFVVSTSERPWITDAHFEVGFRPVSEEITGLLFVQSNENSISGETKLSSNNLLQYYWSVHEAISGKITLTGGLNRDSFHQIHAIGANIESLNCFDRFIGQSEEKSYLKVAHELYHYVLSATEETVDQTLDTIFSKIDHLLSNNQTSSINTLMSIIDASRVHLDALIGVLSITLSARDTLKERDRFLLRVKEELISRGEPADDILIGL